MERASVRNIYVNLAIRLRCYVFFKVLGTFALFSCSFVGFAQINTKNVLLMGQNALYYDDYVLSIRYFNQVIEAKPFLSEPYYFRALAKFYLEDYRSAAEDCSKSIDKNPFIAKTYQLRALCYSNLNQFELAEKDYTAVLHDDKNDQSVWFNRALSRISLKKYDDANADVDSLLKIWPNYVRTYSLKAQLMFEKKDTVAGMEWLTKSLLKDSHNAPAWAFKGSYELQKKKYAAADSSLSKAIAENPQMIGYYLNRALARYNLNRYGDVLSDYDNVLKLDPQNFIAHYNRGLLRSQVGDLNRAINDFSFVIKMEPSNMLAILNRAELREKTGDYKGAIRDYSSILKLYPNFLYGYYSRAKCRRKIGDITGAVRDERKIYLSQLDNTFSPLQRKKIKKVRRRSDPTLENYKELVVEDKDTMQVYQKEYRGKVQNQKVLPQSLSVYLLVFSQQGAQSLSTLPFAPELASLNKLNITKGKVRLGTVESVLESSESEQLFDNIKSLDGLIEKQANEKVLLIRSAAYATSKNFDRAFADADAALKKDSTDVLARLQLSSIIILQQEMVNRTEEQSKKIDVLKSVDLLTQAMKHGLPNAYLYYNRAYMYSLVGKNQLALADYSKAIDIDASFAEAYYNRALIYRIINQKEKAALDFSKAGQLGFYKAYSLLKQFEKASSNE